MTPREKSVDLIEKYTHKCYECDYPENAKQGAIICVNEILESYPLEPTNVDWDDCGATHKYWYETRRDEAKLYWQQVLVELQSF